jgi:hypothetical protein
MQQNNGLFGREMEKKYISIAKISGKLLYGSKTLCKHSNGKLNLARNHAEGKTKLMRGVKRGATLVVQRPLSCS